MLRLEARPNILSNFIRPPKMWISFRRRDFQQTKTEQGASGVKSDITGNLSIISYTSLQKVFVSDTEQITKQKNRRWPIS